MGLCHKGQFDHLNPEKILICQLRQIGDVLLATPSIRMLKARWPEAKIDVLTEKKCAPVLLNNPDVHLVHELDKNLGFFDALKFYKHVGRSGYDLIIDFQQLPRCKWVMMFARNCIKMTYTPSWYNRFFYTHWTPPGHSYAAKAKSAVLAPFGLEYAGEPPRIYLTEEEKEWAQDFIASNKILPNHKLILVDATHGRITRCWPDKYYAKFMKEALKKDEDLRFLLLFGPSEKEYVNKVLKLAGDDSRIIVPSTMLTLRQMAAVISLGEVLVGNCSSPRHFAVAVDTKSLIISGSTSAPAWRYRSDSHIGISQKRILDCHPCNSNKCSHRRCLEEITPERVLSAFWDLFELNKQKLPEKTTCPRR